MGLGDTQNNAPLVVLMFKNKKQTTTKICKLNKGIFYNHTITSLLGDLAKTELFGMIIWKR